MGVVEDKFRPKFDGRNASSQHDAPRDPPADQKSGCRCKKSPANGLNDAFPIGIHELIRDVLIRNIVLVKAWDQSGWGASGPHRTQAQYQQFREASGQPT